MCLHFIEILDDSVLVGLGCYNEIPQTGLWRLGSPSSWHWQIQCLARSFFLDCCILAVSSQAGRGKGVFLILYIYIICPYICLYVYIGTNSIHGGPVTLNHLPKTPPWRLGFHYELWEDANIQTMADGKTSKEGCYNGGRTSTELEH